MIEISLPLITALSVSYIMVGDTSPVSLISRNSFMFSLILDTMLGLLNISELNFHGVLRFFLVTRRERAIGLWSDKSLVKISNSLILNLSTLNIKTIIKPGIDFE